MQKETYIVTEEMSKASLWKDAVPFLGRIDMELTERCNNNCVHCCVNLGADDASAKKRELTTKQVKDILKEIVALGCFSVRFTGGEPLLREDFEELYVFARKLGLKVMIFTNATLVTPHLAELFCQIPPLEMIEISVYGMKKASYEAVTQVKGSFAAAWRGINLLWDHKIPFVVKGALLPSNKDEVEAFKKWAKTIPWMKDALPLISIYYSLRRRRDDQKKNLMIKENRLGARAAMKFLTRNKKAYIESRREYCPKFMRPPADKLFNCGAGCGACVDAFGNLYPCISLRHPDCAYDLKKNSLKEAFTDYFPKMREIKATNEDYLHRCAKCFLYGLCEQCPAKSWAEHGTLDTPVEYLCEIAHAEAHYLGLLKHRERAWEVDNWRDRINILCKKEEP
jgi:radical SAM protein with 4Fe4S-binding SPASM domain